MLRNCRPRSMRGGALRGLGPALSIAGLLTHPEVMADPDYKLTLAQLEREVHVLREDQVEEVSTAAADPQDPRGSQPDRDWFAAGG